ncbi:MAG: hypothetical protein H8D67_18955 [Deltaproteobacteria bacterium]|nr:hypothetical protein [Deltaproteobacteria bacterium]
MAYILRLDDILVPGDIAKPITISVSLVDDATAEIIAREDVTFDGNITLAEAKATVREWAAPYVERKQKQIAASTIIGLEFPFEEPV